MFKELKRNTEDRAQSLYKLFPSWPHLALDFISQCLRLDPSHHPSSVELIRHLYFTHDHFSENFLPILKAKIREEFQRNPLLQKNQVTTFLNSAAQRLHECGITDLTDSKGDLFMTTEVLILLW
jgi:serine/threonine protein kinase